MRATGGLSPLRSANQMSPRGHVRVTPASRPSATVTSMSSQAQPQPAHVASATCRHLQARFELGTQLRGLLLEARQRLLRRRGSRHHGADRMARGDALARVRDVAHATLQPGRAVANGHILGGEEDRLAAGAPTLGLDAWQLTGAGAQMRVEDIHAVRRLDGLERRGWTRVDLDRPRALPVPYEVDAEQSAQLERARQGGADAPRL